jgi:hypothetical protein
LRVGGPQKQNTRAIQAWLSDKSINNTVIYTAVAPDQFDGFCRQKARSSKAKKAPARSPGLSHEPCDATRG